MTIKIDSRSLLGNTWFKTMIMGKIGKILFLLLNCFFLRLRGFQLMQPNTGYSRN